MQDGGSKTEIPISRAVIWDKILMSKAVIMLSGTADAGTCTAKLDGLPTTIKSNLAADKPEVVITTVGYLIEVRSQTLIPCIQESSTQVNVDRHRIPAASWWNPRWPPETGSSNNFACIIGTNAISNAITMLPRVADTMDRRPTPNSSCI
jgi:hypothetical protein